MIHRLLDWLYPPGPDLDVPSESFWFAWLWLYVWAALIFLFNAISPRANAG